MADISTEVKTPSKKINPKVQKDIIMCVVVLVSIAVASGLILGALNYVTYVDPEGVIMGNISEMAGVSLDQVQKLDPSLIQNIAGSKSFVNNCYFVEGEDGITYYYQATGAGCKGGTMELMVVVAPDGKIKDIQEIKSNETAGYFKKVYGQLVKKYIGKNLMVIDHFELIKADKTPQDDTQIPGVSTATYTSTGFNNAISAAAYEYKTRVGGANNEK